MSLVLSRLLSGAVVCWVLLAAMGVMAQTALPSLSDPAISPDGKEIAFVSGGDIWTVAAAGGEATRNFDLVFQAANRFGIAHGEERPDGCSFFLDEIQ